ncbi:hypothetical protein [Neobacillus cucumis]|uniref:hypothetical protein n=1 Tax=Neobacillus cucumis TaxID=1740721 RepID=UPI002E1B637C|nr:hypothetical protein [Neobacillus cucumis]
MAKKVELEKVTIKFFDAEFDKQAWVSGCLFERLYRSKLQNLDLKNELEKLKENLMILKAKKLIKLHIVRANVKKPGI